jgi:hypothetical protein
MPVVPWATRRHNGRVIRRFVKAFRISRMVTMFRASFMQAGGRVETFDLSAGTGGGSHKNVFDTEA